MVRIIGLNSLKSKLKKLQTKAKQADDASVITGYTQSYAIFVHEIPARHKEGKSDKFLEKPLRQLSNSGELASIVERVMKQTGNLEKALFTAALRVQRDSQKIVPVETGALKNSAFTAKESGLNGQ